jgi:hypothetical protein
MNGANWSDPLSTHCGRCGAQIKGHAIVDAEVVCLDSKGIAQSWIKVKNPKAPAATRILDGTFLVAAPFATKDAAGSIPRSVSTCVAQPESRIYLHIVMLRFGNSTLKLRTR